jgi:hypothetical protein
MTTLRLIAAFALACLVAALPGTAAAKTVTKTCKGPPGGTCTAAFSLKGGASNETLVIELPGTSYRKPRVSVSPSSLKGAYDLSGGRFRLGGSEYTVKLSAVGSIRRGTLTFTFTPKA